MAHEELIFGWHAVNATLKYEPTRLRAIWLEQGRHDHRARAFMDKARQLGIPVREEQGAVLDRMTGGGRHQGVVARSFGASPVLSRRDLPSLLSSCKGPPLLLALDQVQDPHNLGACLRSADAAGVHAVIVPTDRAAGITATVRKVACGAAETVPFAQVVNLACALREMRDEHGLQIVGGASEAQVSLYDTDLTVPTVVVLGAEEKGLRRLTRDVCDVLVKIPMTGKVESLNVSVAAGVFLFEALRQRTRRKTQQCGVSQMPMHYSKRLVIPSVSEESPPLHPAGDPFDKLRAGSSLRSG